MKGLFILAEYAYDLIYGPEELAEIHRLVEIHAPPLTPESIMEKKDLLRETELIFSGWGGPRIDADFLAAAPKLKAVFYGAGTIRGIVTESFWERGVRITSAYAANAVPVAEFTLSQILFALKRGWYYVTGIRQSGGYLSHISVPGCYGSTVGIVSLGMIGRKVVELLQPFDLRIIAYDPFVSAETAAKIGVELCSLEEVFRRADVVSLHTPWLPETEGLITGEHFLAMKRDATFINTARGAIVREIEMIGVLQERPDICAVLDVTHPEPPVPGSPLYTLPNVILTPHIAGSMGRECQRMGRYMVDELHRFLHGEPMLWEITKEKAAIMA